MSRLVGKQNQLSLFTEEGLERHSHRPSAFEVLHRTMFQAVHLQMENLWSGRRKRKTTRRNLSFLCLIISYDPAGIILTK